MENNNAKNRGIFIRKYNYIDGLEFDLSQLDEFDVRYEKLKTDEDSMGNKLNGDFYEVIGVKKCSEGHIVDITLLMEGDILKTLHLTKKGNCFKCLDITSRIAAFGVFEYAKIYMCEMRMLYIDNGPYDSQEKY
jgi:hypothetical protein